MTAQLVIDFATARAQRDAGIRQAIDRAERADPTWGDRALDWIRGYALSHPSFVSEEVTALADRAGLVAPTDPRAWGSPFRQAIKAGYIVQDGYGRSARRHASICPRWRSLIYNAPRPAA